MKTISFSCSEIHPRVQTAFVTTGVISVGSRTDKRFYFLLLLEKVTFLFIWYINNVAWAHQREGGENVVELICTFLVSVGASVVAYYICKWLDGND